MCLIQLQNSLYSFQDLALVCPLAGEIFNLGNINTRPNSTRILGGNKGEHVLFCHSR